MKFFSCILIVTLFFLPACGQPQKETALQKLCARIRLAPQTPFPAGRDEKWQLIRQMDSLPDPAAPDSLKALFTSIDTAIRGYNEYHYAILARLARPDSEKSLKILSAIFKENYISDPLCSQLLTDMFFMGPEMQANMFKAYLAKEKTIDYSHALQHVEVMFPNLAHILGRRPFTDRPVLDLMKMGIEAKRLNRDNLAGSRADLVRYYYLLKQVKANPASGPLKDYRYERYYESHIGDLLQILHIFEPGQELKRIFEETADIKA